MNAILTSALGGQVKIDGKRYPSRLLEANGLLNHIQAVWKKNSRVMIISGSPTDYDKNDSVLFCLSGAFTLSDLSASEVVMCDERNREIIERLSEMDVLVLAGGHVPTQNRFFNRIRLRKLLKSYGGLVIGISAGSMNSAETVYAQPELEGEALDPAYLRFLPGLGLTETMLLPHWQYVRGTVLDGLRVCEDITLPVSRGRCFYAIPDGTYLLIENGRETLHGEACRIRDGVIERIAGDGETVLI